MDNEIIKAAYNEPFGLRDIEGIILIASLLVVTVWGLWKFYKLNKLYPKKRD